MKNGQIIVLSGQPRAGKSRIARVIQATFPGDWLVTGVDAQMQALPAQLQPGIGLRPGGERPALEPVIRRLYAVLFATLAAYSRQGFNVVADVGLHDGYSQPLGLVALLHRQLAGLPLVVVGVTAAPEVIAARRKATWHKLPPAAVLDRWATAVAATPVDLTVDSGELGATGCAARIRDFMKEGGAF
ncbi:phosphotransferase-like protein [Lacticaseibacillus parakribbianus]|uniref:phosphotransferase-like protein n=1 Tax=Lacticaseibacillus parakribbianus TaxID=2970927 RepID=UPI0021CB8319